MSLPKFQASLTNSLRHSALTAIDRTIRKSPEMKDQALSDLDRFIKSVEYNSLKIFNYATIYTPKEDFKISVGSPYFRFNYTVFKDKSSDLEVIMMNRVKSHLDSTFLTKRVSPKYGFVYILQSEAGYKIGCTSRLEKRFGELKILLPFTVTIHSLIRGRGYTGLEKVIHELLDHKRLNGEWFNLSDSDFDDLDKFISNMGLRRETDPAMIEHMKTLSSKAYNAEA